jgi:predicted acylesterase/phospholipase RssA
VPITLDHILASCSIPMIYPPTKIGDVAFWDGGTVANTPLGPAIDAGSGDIVVVLMTPWEDEKNRPRHVSAGGLQGLLATAQAAVEWTLLASFQTDLKLFNRTNEVVRLSIENARLRAENVALKIQVQQAQVGLAPQGEGGALKHQEIQPPVIVSPRQPIPLLDMVRYSLDNHERLYEMGYEDAKAAWERVGRAVEGGST